MSVINMARTIKEIHPRDLICYKVGAFYNCFGKDAYVLSYVFKYKIKKDSKIATCGFPKGGLVKAMAKLEQNKINYLIIDTRNNYDVDYKMDFKNLNTYEEKLKKAKKYVKRIEKINKIQENLEENVENDNIEETIKRIEEIVYANRKI